MSFVLDGTRMEIDGRELDDGGGDPFLRLLPTLAAVAGSFPETEVIEVRLRGTGRKCTYERDFFIGASSNHLISTCRAGRAMAKVLRQTKSEARLASEARYLLVGPVATLIEAVG